VSEHFLRTHLQSEVCARDQAIARLQAELQAQSQASELQVSGCGSEHAPGGGGGALPSTGTLMPTRPPASPPTLPLTAPSLPPRCLTRAQLTQLQDTYLAKLADMRELHRQQLLAAAEAAQVIIRPAPCRSQRHLVTLVGCWVDVPVQQLMPTAALRPPPQEQAARLGQLREQELSALKQQLAEAGAREQQLAQQLARLQQQVQQLERLEQERQLEQAQQQAAAAAGPAGGGMLGLMEAQLQRLSGALRSREEEVHALQSALLAGAEERKGLQQELAAARQLLASQAAAGGRPTAAALPKQRSSSKQQQAAQAPGGGVVWGAASSSHGRSSRTGKV
jgi:DNA repair exonuclease SbcCD ATPase subunit